MKLLIAIPAYNEEQSIEPIIRRSLDARRHIVTTSPVTRGRHLGGQRRLHRSDPGTGAEARR